MSYCVHCGVELDATAQKCPLCGVPVSDPLSPRDGTAPTPYPTRFTPVEPPNKSELALLLSAMLASVAVVCALLNLFLAPGRLWSLYVIGGAITLWLWLVLPLLLPKIPLVLRVIVDGAAVAVYLYLICLDLDGLSWYLPLALPIVLTVTALCLVLSLLLPRRSILTGTAFFIGSIGIFSVLLELFIDLYATGRWEPRWSLVVAAASAALVIPLVVVRQVPGLREQVRRKFHF